MSEARCFNCMESLKECECSDKDRHTFTNEIDGGFQCPCCEYTHQDIWDIDRQLYEEGDTEVECSNCGEILIVHTAVTYDFSTYKKEVEQ